MLKYITETTKTIIRVCEVSTAVQNLLSLINEHINNDERSKSDIVIVRYNKISALTCLMERSSFNNWPDISEVNYVI